MIATRNGCFSFARSHASLAYSYLAIGIHWRPCSQTRLLHASIGLLNLQATQRRPPISRPASGSSSCPTPTLSSILEQGLPLQSRSTSGLRPRFPCWRSARMSSPDDVCNASSCPVTFISRHGAAAPVSVIARYRLQEITTTISKHDGDQRCTQLSEGFSKDCQLSAVLLKVSTDLTSASLELDAALFLAVQHSSCHAASGDTAVLCNFRSSHVECSLSQLEFGSLCASKDKASSTLRHWRQFLRKMYTRKGHQVV